MATDVGSAVGYLDLDISGFLAGLKSAQTEANTTSQSITSKFGSNLTGIGKGLTTAGSTMTKGVTLPIVGAGAAIIKTTSDFETGMSKVSAISGATGNDLDKLNKKAQEMGAKTKFSATESAEAFTYMAMAGWKTEDMLEGIEGIMSLAAADGLDLATTSDIVTDALTAFGMTAGDSGHFADVLAKASSNANTNVSMLGESFKYAAPVAGALGFSAEDTAIALGLMANAGIKGSQGGTALRGSLAKLVKPTDNAAALMEQYGLSITNTDGSMKSLKEIMDMLRQNMGGLTEAEQAQAAATIFGQEAMSGMLAIINASDSDYQKLTESIYNADGAAKQMSETMLDNLSGQITLLKSALEGLAIQFGDIMMPYIKSFVGWLQNLVQKLQELSPEQKEQVAKWALIAAAIGPCLLILGKLTTSVGNTITMFSKIPGMVTGAQASFGVLKTSLMNVKEGFTLAKAGFSGLATEAGGFGTKIGAMAAGVTGPMLAIVAVVAVVIAAFVSLWKNNEEFRNNVTAIWNQIKETFSNFTQGIVDRLNSLGFNFQSITDVIKAVWEGFCNFLAPIFEGVFQQIANAFKFVTDSILNTFDFWIAIFKGDWEGAWNAIKAQFENVWNFIKNTFQNMLNTMKGLLDTVLGWFGTSWEKCWNGIKTFFVNTWNGIKSTAESVWNGIKNFFTNSWNSIKSTATSVWNGIKSLLSNSWNGIKTTATTVWNGIKNAIMNPIDTAKNLIKGAIDTIKGFFNFKISWPKVPMPHFSITPSGWKVGDLLKGSIPKLGISWYAKAMDKGMILNGPTIFGMDKNGNLLGGGEAGSETVVGTKSLLQMIRQAVSEAIGPMIAVTRQLALASGELGYVAHNGFTKQNEVIEKIINSKGASSNGDTYNFYSPKAIDEIEAAKQMKKTKRELAEGF